MKITYIVSLFPKLSETFILRELVEVARRGHDLSIVSLKSEREPVVHDEALPFVARTRHPSVDATMFLGVVRAVARHPQMIVGIVARVLRAHLLTPGLLIKSLALVPVAMQIARHVSRDGTMHLHAHWASHPALVAWMVSRLTGIPYSVTAHAHDIFLPNPMLAEKVRGASFFATISEFNRAFIMQACGPGVLARVRLIRCGLPLEEFPFGVRPDPERGATMRVLSVGRLVDYKGFDVLIRACAILRERGRSLRCKIIGEGPERPRLEQLICDLGLEEWVELPGSVRQRGIHEAMRGADLFVLPCVVGHDGQQDGIPIVLMEAMAYGVPVVSTKLSGIPELIKDGRTGLLAAPGDPEHLAGACERLLDDTVLRSAVRADARRLIETEFDLSRSVTLLCDAFERGPAGRVGAPGGTATS